MEQAIHPGWGQMQIDLSKTNRAIHSYLVGACAQFAWGWDGVRSAARAAVLIAIMDSPANAVPAMEPGNAGSVAVRA